MTAKNARIVANAIVLAGGGVLAFLVWRQPSVRRAALRALPMVLGGAPPWQVAAFAIANTVAAHAHEVSVSRQATTREARTPGSREPR
jgi:hypothetical protein